MIERHSLEDGRITEFRGTGASDFTELTSTIRDFYGEIGPALLWDLREGTIASLTTDELRTVSRLASERRSDGSTAYVVGTDVDYGMLRMYEVISEIQGVTQQRKVFRERAHAVAWLLERLEE